MSLPFPLQICAPIDVHAPASSTTAPTSQKQVSISLRLVHYSGRRALTSGRSAGFLRVLHHARQRDPPDQVPCNPSQILSARANIPAELRAHFKKLAMVPGRRFSGPQPHAPRLPQADRPRRAVGLSERPDRPNRTCTNLWGDIHASGQPQDTPAQQQFSRTLDA